MRNTFILIFSFLFIFFYSADSQEKALKEYLNGKHEIEKRSMIVLTSWGGINLTSGLIGMSISTDESAYFHQMNAAWGAINTGIGLAALLTKAESPNNLKKIVEQDHRLEKILYINTGLDVAYMTAGFLLRAQGQNDQINEQRFTGFGNALLIQGGFLFAFDVIQIIVNSNYRKANESLLWNNLSLSDSGLGLKYTFN